VIRQDIGHCAVLQLNRPEVLNAFSDTSLDELNAHLENIEHDATRAMILVGKRRAFYARSDLGAEQADPEARVLRFTYAPAGSACLRLC